MEHDSAEAWGMSVAFELVLCSKSYAGTDLSVDSSKLIIW